CSRSGGCPKRMTNSSLSRGSTESLPTTETTIFAEISASPLKVEKSSLLNLHLSSLLPECVTSRQASSSSMSVRMTTRYSTAPFSNASGCVFHLTSSFEYSPVFSASGLRIRTGGSSEPTSSTKPDHFAILPVLVRQDKSSML